MHLWAPYITRSTCCWANSKISFISVSCKISREKQRPRVFLVFCSRFFYALSNAWNSTQHWFVSKVVGLHHWIGWWLKFFCWKSSAKWVTETQLDDGTWFSFRQWNTPLPFYYCNTCREMGCWFRHPVLPHYKVESAFMGMPERGFWFKHPLLPH